MKILNTAAMLTLLTLVSCANTAQEGARVPAQTQVGNGLNEESFVESTVMLKFSGANLDTVRSASIGYVTQSPLCWKMEKVDGVKMPQGQIKDVEYEYDPEMSKIIFPVKLKDKCLSRIGEFEQLLRIGSSVYRITIYDNKNAPAVANIYCKSNFNYPTDEKWESERSVCSGSVDKDGNPSQDSRGYIGRNKSVTVNVHLVK